MRQVRKSPERSKRGTFGCSCPRPTSARTQITAECSLTPSGRVGKGSGCGRAAAIGTTRGT
eukprot:5404129-Alexandrium_andersonii.AAC.1